MTENYFKDCGRNSQHSSKFSPDEVDMEFDTKNDVEKNAQKHSKNTVDFTPHHEDVCLQEHTFTSPITSPQQSVLKGK